MREEDSKYSANYIDFIMNIATVRKLNLLEFCKEKLDGRAQQVSDAVKKNEAKASNNDFIFMLLIRMVYIIIFISTIYLVRAGGDGLAYLLFYITLLATMYSKLNFAARALDLMVEFTTAKKQLEAYFLDS